MGCGTGILAILAKKLGAAEVLGIDIDDWSVENAIENCASNGFPEIEIVKGDADLLEEQPAFDFILANINKNVLRAHMPSYSKKLKKGGHLFLSGFFVTDVDDLKNICAAEELEFVSLKNEEEWAMAYLIKS
jgi:ribosomal protein L11 methyltransferase